MPFQEEYDRGTIDMHEVMYGAHPNAAWRSIISTQLTVLAASANSLADLLEDDETAVVDQDVGDSDGVTKVFSGTLDPHPSTPRTVKIKPSSVTFTVTVSAGSVDITDNGSGVLSGTGVTGTIDYDTGEWTFTCTTAPDDAEDVLVDYTWFYILPSEAQGFWLYPAGDIRATFDGQSVPTSSVGMLIGEAIMLSGQSNLMANSSFIAGSDTALDIEIMV